MTPASTLAIALIGGLCLRWFKGSPLTTRDGVIYVTALALILEVFS